MNIQMHAIEWEIRIINAYSLIKSTYSSIFYFVSPSQLIKTFSIRIFIWIKNLFQCTNLQSFVGAILSVVSNVIKPGRTATQSNKK